MDPADEAQTPIGSIQADDPRADVIESYGPFEQATREGSIVKVGWREQKEEGQAGATTEQGMDAIAAQEWTRMLSGSMTKGGIRVGSMPRQNGSTIDDQIASTDEPTTQGSEYTEHEEGFGQRGASLLSTFALLGRTGNTGTPILAQG
jgi:hypothetical protein